LSSHKISSAQSICFSKTVSKKILDASNPTSVAKIYDVKGRPTDHPIIVHISSISQMDKWAVNVPEYAINLARNFLPGPMTLILKRSQLAKDFITGGQDLVGLRVPSHPTALMLMKEFENLGGFGVAAPSANRFGAVSPTTSEAVIEELDTFLSRKDLLLEGRHFFPDVDPYTLGHKSLAVSLSDLAAMGAKPVACLLGLALPSFDEAWVESTDRKAVARSDRTETELSLAKNSFVKEAIRTS
jgi:L-threonylcarbamoyladenylate synthase